MNIYTLARDLGLDVVVYTSPDPLQAEYWPTLKQLLISNQIDKRFIPAIIAHEIGHAVATIKGKRFFCCQHVPFSALLEEMEAWMIADEIAEMLDFDMESYYQIKSVALISYFQKVEGFSTIFVGMGF